MSEEKAIYNAGPSVRQRVTVEAWLGNVHVHDEVEVFEADPAVMFREAVGLLQLRYDFSRRGIMPSNRQPVVDSQGTAECGAFASGSWAAAQMCALSLGHDGPHSWGSPEIQDKLDDLTCKIADRAAELRAEGHCAELVFQKSTALLCGRPAGHAGPHSWAL